MIHARLPPSFITPPFRPCANYTGLSDASHARSVQRGKLLGVVPSESRNQGYVREYDPNNAGKRCALEDYYPFHSAIAGYTARASTWNVMYAVAAQEARNIRIL